MYCWLLGWRRDLLRFFWCHLHYYFYYSSDKGWWWWCIDSTIKKEKRLLFGCTRPFIITTIVIFSYLPKSNLTNYPPPIHPFIHPSTKYNYNLTLYLLFCNLLSSSFWFTPFIVYIHSIFTFSWFFVFFVLFFFSS